MALDSIVRLAFLVMSSLTTVSHADDPPVIVIEVGEPRPTKNELARSEVAKDWPKERLERADSMRIGGKTVKASAVRKTIIETTGGAIAEGAVRTVRILLEAHPDQAFDYALAVMPFGIEDRLIIDEVRLKISTEDKTGVVIRNTKPFFFGEETESTTLRFIDVRQAPRGADRRRVMYRGTLVSVDGESLSGDDATIDRTLGERLAAAKEDATALFLVNVSPGVPMRRMSSLLTTLEGSGRRFELLSRLIGSSIDLDIDRADASDAGAAILRARRDRSAQDKRLTHAIDWLARSLFDDGGWHADDDMEPLSDVGLTGLGLLGLVSQGVGDSDRDWGGRVQKIIRFLFQSQQASGVFGEREKHLIYNHAIALHALLEFHRLRPRNADRNRLGSAVTYLIERQSPSGGFPSDEQAGEPDLLTTAWALRALSVAVELDLDIPAEPGLLARKWLTSLDRKSTPYAGILGLGAHVSARLDSGMAGENSAMRDLRSIAFSAPTLTKGAVEGDPEGLFLAAAALRSGSSLESSFGRTCRRLLRTDVLSGEGASDAVPDLTTERSSATVWTPALLLALDGILGDE